MICCHYQSLLMLALLIAISVPLNNASFTSKVFLTLQPDIQHIVDTRFLSFALDSNVIKKHWINFDFRSPRLHTLASALGPAYLRVGGSNADCLMYCPSDPLWESLIGEHLTQVADNLCESANRQGIQTPVEHFRPEPFNMTGTDWHYLTQFVRDANLRLLFDLNVGFRGDNGGWDSTNAKLLFLDTVTDSVDWQLGNEPNAFRHIFGKGITASQLAKDFTKLKGLIGKVPGGLVVGPDVTRPLNLGIDSIKFIARFLNKVGSAVDAVTWHQYYVNGRTAILDDFLSPQTLDILRDQTIKVLTVVRRYNPDVPVWLTETGSAYGGGAPGLSDRYVAGFMWLDKLGLSATLGISVVVRQSFYHGSYSLIDEFLRPLPDWWLSYLYNQVVGSQVLKTNVNGSPHIRLYAHCTARHYAQPGSITVFGMNLDKERNEVILTPDLAHIPRHEFILSAADNDLTSRHVLLNGRLLAMVTDTILPPMKARMFDPAASLFFPHYSMAFWVFPDADVDACSTTT